MAAWLRKACQNELLGLLHPSSNTVRSVSTSTALFSSSSTESVPKKPKGRNKKKNLFEVAQFLPNWGIGYKMAKSHWRDVCYEITKINLYKDGHHGKAWGIRYKAGLQATDAPVKLSGVNKSGWRYIAQSKEKASSEKAKNLTPA